MYRSIVVVGRDRWIDPSDECEGVMINDDTRPRADTEKDEDVCDVCDPRDDGIAADADADSRGATHAIARSRVFVFVERKR